MSTTASCDKLGCMKNNVISELVSVVAIGALFGFGSNAIHQKWHRLGRDAFLAHESQNFDKLYSNSSSLMHSVLLFVMLAAPVYLLYKGISIVAAKFLSKFADKDEATQQ
jgi:hypothetical protein